MATVIEKIKLFFGMLFIIAIHKKSKDKNEAKIFSVSHGFLFSNIF
jgi:hypothetical protein